MSVMERLKTRPAMPFVDYMQEALYAPESGYYSSGLQKFGKGGDFITAPLLTPYFARTLARQIEEVFSVIEKPVLLEFGAGSGQLAVDLLIALEQDEMLPERYYILELSAALKARQQALIEEEIPHLLHRVEWLDRWPETPLKGVFIANEVLDAMPVHRFMKNEQGFFESMVKVDDNGQLIEYFEALAEGALKRYIENHLPRLPVPYLSEANLFIEGWLQSMAQALEQGAVFLIDYGFPRHEYYHPDRAQGTLIGHYRHTATHDLLAHPGEQDITAHVDFTHVAEAADKAGFHVAGYTSQAAFLLANGILDAIACIHDERERLNTNAAVKQLLQPQEMGELFKVMAITRNLDIDLRGFLLQDRRASL